MTDAVALEHPWTDGARQRVAMQFGMWSFIATETLFFGGILLFYAFARFDGGAGFVAGARESDAWFGSINTIVLMTSSLTMVVAERATREEAIRLARAMLAATVALGLTFLVVKGFEYRSDIEKYLVPGPHFAIAARGASQFWAFYWTATVVHAIHLTIGLGVVGRLLLIAPDRLARHWTKAEGSALYWHLVDIVWVILFPLIYLVGRS